jgi:hypothetical protein
MYGIFSRDRTFNQIFADYMVGQAREKASL